MITYVGKISCIFKCVLKKMQVSKILAQFWNQFFLSDIYLWSSWIGFIYLIYLSKFKGFGVVKREL